MQEWQDMQVMARKDLTKILANCSVKLPLIMKLRNTELYKLHRIAETYLPNELASLVTVW